VRAADADRLAEAGSYAEAEPNFSASASRAANCSDCRLYKSREVPIRWMKYCNTVKRAAQQVLGWGIDGYRDLTSTDALNQVPSCRFSF